MLVLSRMVGEWIKIGDDIWVGVTKIDSNRVKISINAPKSIRILRHEMVGRSDGGTDPALTGDGK